MTEIQVFHNEYYDQAYLQGDDPESFVPGGTMVIPAGSVGFKELASNAVRGVNIHDGTITAEKLSVTSLSAISAVMGTLVAGDLHIPDETSPESFHVDSIGNVWWGCSVDAFVLDRNNAVSFILHDGYARFSNVELTSTVALAYTNANHFTANYLGDDVDASFVLNRTTGGAMHLVWNGVTATLNRPFDPLELIIHNISDTEPVSPVAGQVWLDP